MLCFKKEPVSPVSRFGVAGLLQQNRFCIFQRFRPDPMGPDDGDPMMGPDDGTRWDPDLSDLSDPRCWFGVSWIQTVRISFISNGFPWLRDWFIDIYGMIYLDPCGPRQRPHFNRAWQRFAPQGDPRVAPWWCHAVKRSGTFTHPLRQRSLQYYAILFEYYLNIVWILFEYYVVTM